MEEMTRKNDTRGNSMQLIARIVMIVAAVCLVGAFFLPWASANSEYREGAEAMPDIMFYEPTNLTAADAADLSLMEYAQVYGSMSGTGFELYMYIMYGLAAISVLVLVFAAFGKSIPSGIFAVLSLVLCRILVWDLESRGVLPNSTHEWGIAPNIYLVATIVLVAAAIWLLVVKHKAKAEGKNETLANPEIQQ